ncbi:tRNA (adenine(58)-N(1))-methyltransferase non-catalytic subunit trm6, partial [Spiromyces aspiralis]
PFAEEWSDSFTENQAKSFKRRQTRHQRINDLLGRLKSTKFDSLIISTKYDSGSVVRLLEGFLGPSRVIVVHSPNKESLLTAYEYLRTSPKFINVNISESWLRQYQ